MALVIATVNHHIYVANQNFAGSDVVNIDSDATNSRITSVRLSYGQISIALDPVRGDLYASDFDVQNVIEISGTTNSVIRNISLGPEEYPSALVVDPLNGVVYVANYGTFNVVVITPALPNSGLATWVWVATGVGLSVVFVASILIIRGWKRRLDRI